MRTRYTRLLVWLSALVVALFILSLAIGPAALGPITGLKGLFNDGHTAAAVIIMRDIRLPRALLGLLVGASLGLSGAALQGFLRNPLAEPGIIGVSSFASLGAVVVFYTGLAGSTEWAVPGGALFGALLAVLILLLIAAGNTTTLTLILAGVALASLASALTTLALNLSPNPFATYEVIFWLFGSLKDHSMAQVWVSLPITLLGWLLIVRTGPALDALSFGEEAAVGLGVNLARARLLIVAGVALCVGAGTAITGAIGFVGLVVPHVLRPLTDGMPRRLLLPSALGGAALLLVADIGARVVIPTRELNVGVLTALIGAPFFIYLVIRSRTGANL